MKRLTYLVGFVVLILCAFPVTAQTKPDFSGRWVSEPTMTGTETNNGNPGSGWGANIIITQNANRLTVEYAFFARGDMQPPLRFVFALDGTETKNSVMMGRGIQTQTSKTMWEGNKLVITTMHSFENPANGQPLKVEVKQTLALESPIALIVETTRGGALGGLASTTRTAYKKN